MPAKFQNSGKSAHFTVRDDRGRWSYDQFDGLDIWLPSHHAYRRYSPRVMAFAEMLDWFWRQNAGTLWAWRSSINQVRAYYMKGIGQADRERDLYVKAKEVIREDAFGEYEREGTVFVYASTRGGKALSGYADSALVAEQYDAVNHRMLRLMDNRVATGTVEPAAAAFSLAVKVKRPRIKTLNGN
jgi:hypothetical protein